MNNRSSRWLSMLFILLMSPTYFAIASNDHTEARQLIETGKILPLESILERIREHHPGKVLEVELEKEHGKVIYEIEILDKNGTVTEIYIDAQTGEILFTDKEY